MARLEIPLTREEGGIKLAENKIISPLDKDNLPKDDAPPDTSQNTMELARDGPAPP